MMAMSFSKLEGECRIVKDESFILSFKIISSNYCIICLSLVMSRTKYNKYTSVFMIDLNGVSL